MKKIIFTLFVLFLSSLSLKSQSIKVIEGPEIKSKMRILDIVGEIDNKVYTVFYAKRKFYLRAYNNNLEATGIMEIPSEYQGKPIAYERSIKLQNKLYVLSVFNNKKSHKTFLLYQQIDTDKLKPKGKLQVLGEIPFKSRYDKGDFNIFYSPDTSHILIYHVLPYNKGGKQKLSFSVLDSRLNKIWQKKVTLPYADKLFDLKDITIDDYGNVYVIGKYYKGKRKDIINNRINFNYMIFAYLDKGNEEREYKLEEKERFIIDLEVSIDALQNLIVTGFYSPNLKTISAGGAFYMNIDRKTGEVLGSEFHKFSIDFLTSYMSGRSKKKAVQKAEKKKKKGKEEGMYALKLRPIVKRDDGGFLLFGEQHYVTTVTTYSNNTWHTTYYYHYDHIIVVNFNPDGTVKWERIIPKNQVEVNASFYSSYVLAVFKDNVFIIFNDHVMNTEQNIKAGKLYAFNRVMKKTKLVAYRLDEEGDMERMDLMNASKTGTIPVIPKSEQLDNGDVVIFSDYKKKQRLFKIKFSE